MPHAHHFLSRLDRVSLPHVELALGLYRDEPLLRYILDRARPPEGAARVAISLDHPERGPFLIVTRDGHFVTCLGEGMSPGDLPVITRGQLDAIAARVEDLRARMAAAKDLAGGGGARALIRRIYDAADELCREDFVAISALQPLYAFHFFRLYTGASIDLDDARQILMPQLRKSDRLRPEFKQALRTYWQTLWALGHLGVLSAMDGPAAIPAEVLDAFGQQATVSWPATRQGVLAIALKGAWLAARIGKPVLGAYKRFYHDAITFLKTVDGALGLVANGLRHARFGAEAQKAITSPLPPILEGSKLGAYLRVVRELPSKTMDWERKQPAALAAAHRMFGAEAWMLATKHLPVGAPCRYERAEDVPEDLALTAAVNLSSTFFEGTHTLLWLFTLLPWVARAAPEQLYLPREAFRAIHAPWRPDHTLRALRALRDHENIYPRSRAPEGPARKGPCPCGSGKKYKRCCGEGAAEA